MVRRTDFECACSFSVTGKWRLAEEYDLKMISRLWACDRMVALPTVIKREDCLEVIAGTSQMEGRQSWDCSVHRQLQGNGREAEA